MEIKGLKEKGEDGNGKLLHWNCPRLA